MFNMLQSLPPLPYVPYVPYVQLIGWYQGNTHGDLYLRPLSFHVQLL